MASVKNVTSYSKRFSAFLKLLKLLSICVKFQVNQQEFSIQKKVYGWGNFTANAIPRQRLQGPNTSVGIGFIKLTEPSDTLNYTLHLLGTAIKTVF